MPEKYKQWSKIAIILWNMKFFMPTKSCMQKFADNKKAIREDLESLFV